MITEIPYKTRVHIYARKLHRFWEGCANMSNELINVNTFRDSIKIVTMMERSVQGDMNFRELASSLLKENYITQETFDKYTYPKEDDEPSTKNDTKITEETKA